MFYAINHGSVVPQTPSAWRAHQHALAGAVLEQACAGAAGALRQVLHPVPAIEVEEAPRA
jgi:hypothetical protein